MFVVQGQTQVAKFPGTQRDKFNSAGDTITAREEDEYDTYWIDRVLTGPRPAPEMHGGPTMAVRTAPPELAPAASTILSILRWIASSGKEMTFSMSAMSSYFSSACGGWP